MTRSSAISALLLTTAVLPFGAEAQTTAATADAGQAAPAAPATASDAAADVVVTGSRGLQRTVTQSATPIDVIQGADLERTGKTGVLEALNALVPSFNEPARSGGMNGTIIATGGLRGLNPDQTLILVNGKRRHKTSLIMAGSSSYNGAVPADLSLIAVSAIDHIEVLRDGAAAKYGSDAIAGVINIILKKDTGFVASGGAGQNQDRGDGELYQVEAHLGQRIGDAGFLDLSVQAKQQNASNRANPIASTIRLYPLVNGQPDPREATIDRLVTTNYGALPQKTLNLAYNAGYDLGGGIELYSTGTYGTRRSDLLGAFRAPNNTATITQIFPDGYHPDVVIREYDVEAALGVRGRIGGWEFDLSSSYGQNRSRITDIYTLNPSLGPASPTSFYLGSYKSTEWVNSLDLTRRYGLGGGHLQVSAGLQHRLETYRISAGELASYVAGGYVIPAGQPNAGVSPAPGSQGVSGITPGDAGHTRRNNVAAYLDLAYDPTERLTIDVAGRFEHFDDASGNTLNGEASGRYAITPWLAARGAISTGFRAPALAQQIYSSTTGQFLLVNGQTALTLVKILPVASPAAVALGSKPLTPEKSTNYTAGLVLTPLRHLNLTIDAFDIEVRNRISVTGTLGGTAVTAILLANGLAGNINAQYFTNALNTRTRGVDVVSTYRLGLGRWGRMNLNASFNYTNTTVTNVIANPPQLSSLGAGYALFDRITLLNLHELLPKTKLALGDVWTLGRVTLSGREVRYGSYTIPQLAAANDRHFGAKWITELELSFQAARHIALTAGASNLFNTYPDANGIYNASLGAQQYGASPPSPFGFTGGFYYGRITVTL